MICLYAYFFYLFQPILTMQVYQSPYMTLEVDQANRIIKVIWSADTERMTEETFKQELTKYVEVAEQYRPSGSLVDTGQFLMTVVPEVQSWVQQNIHPRSLQAGVRKFAYIVSKDVFSQVSIEQTMEEEVTGAMFKTQYFDDVAQATEWLMKN